MATLVMIWCFIKPIIAWIVINWGAIPSFLLGVSEMLAVIFPSKTGFGGIFAGIIKFLKGIKKKQEEE